MKTPQRHNPLFMRLGGRFGASILTICGVIKKARRAFIYAGCGVCGVF
jgi:hypothetical protein